ncbi:MAG TPA: amidase family protein [Dehalococcoidia bacterium]|nr:amidase family protein [Dehalococcoidia bacterium]
MARPSQSFRLLEATIADILGAYETRQISVRELVQLYLGRIEALDRAGPRINSVITVNPHVLEDADELDRKLAAGQVMGPLHGVPVLLKDQIDAEGMPTTLGSVLFKNYFPASDAFVVQRLKAAGALILGKATLGELGMGDTHGSLFGSTRNPYDLDRTVGGSSGGPAAAVSANLAAVAIGQEALASIRRPAAWTCVVGMRPTAGLVSRSGVYAGWPGTAASLGPVTRSVADQAILLDVLVAYDPEDPITALGVGKTEGSFTQALVKHGLKGARIGVLRESFGANSEPGSTDFTKVDDVFDNAVRELGEAGAVVTDPIVIPRLKELLAKRVTDGASGDQAFAEYFRRGKNPPFRSRQEMLASPDFAKVRPGPAVPGSGNRVGVGDYLQAREQLMVEVLKVMADLQLDAIVYKSVEHQPTLISEGVRPPFVNIKGATYLNTFLTYVPAVSVPAGFTSDELPVGITFQGRPYDDARVLGLAYGYEQVTHHRISPSSCGPLPGEP